MKFKGFLAGAVLAASMVGTASGVDVAILDSANTKEFFKRHYPDCSPPDSYYLGAEEYQRYFRGWEYVIPTVTSSYEIITDDQVTETFLNDHKIKVLILSNTASLSDEQQKTIRQWVIRGGRLLATFGSGYKSTDPVPESKEIDKLKQWEGGTFGLHQLWHDPMTKLFGSENIEDAAGTDVRITQYEGPTKWLAGQLVNDLLLYGAESNLLVQRPEDHKTVFGFVQLKERGSEDSYLDDYRPTPAIISTSMSKGLVVYFAFAPEYLVSKEFDLPEPLASTCPDGQNWVGRSDEAQILMISAVEYLLSN